MKRIIFIIFLLIKSNSIFSEIEIRFAKQNELQDILEFDRQVSFEFFKPLYETYYSNFALGKNPNYYLELDIKNDAKSFPDYINSINNKRILIAFDNKKNCIVGLLTFHKEEKLLELDLLLISKDNRKQGIGKKLVHKSLSTFSNIDQCVVYPLKFGNDSALKFYESLGFENLGSYNSDELNSYGIKYKDMHFYYKMRINN